MSLSMPGIAYWKELEELLGDEFDSVDNDIIYLNSHDESAAEKALSKLEQKYAEFKFELYYDEDCECWTIEVL